MNEIWKDIPGYEGEYQVSNLGRVKSLKNDKEKILKGRKSSNGYLRVILYKNNKFKEYHIHRLIALTFMGEPTTEKYYYINHIDEDKTNNKLENLQYCTIAYNTNYGSRNEKVGKKLSKPVIGINKISGYICEFSSTVEAERSTGINNGHICNCCNGKSKSAGGYKWFYKNNEEVK